MSSSREIDDIERVLWELRVFLFCSEMGWRILQWQEEVMRNLWSVLMSCCNGMDFCVAFVSVPHVDLCEEGSKMLLWYRLNLFLVKTGTLPGHRYNQRSILIITSAILKRTWGLCQLRKSTLGLITFYSGRFHTCAYNWCVIQL